MCERDRRGLVEFVGFSGVWQIFFGFGVFLWSLATLPFNKS